MKPFSRALFLTLIAVLALGGCSEDAGDTDTGGVELVISDFDGLPSVVSVNAATAGGVALVTVEEITLESIVENPDLGTSDLQTIRLSSYEIRFSRADAGERVPTPLVEGLLGTVPVGGETTINNLPILRTQQLLEPPLSDLLLVNGAFDRETGESTIFLNLTIRFFGETLGGRNVASLPQTFPIEFVP